MMSNGNSLNGSSGFAGGEGACAEAAIWQHWMADIQVRTD